MSERSNGEGGNGLRKDGKTFAPGNTREDGSYVVGDRRAPAQHRFAVGDGRMRGRRSKGSKGAKSLLHEALNAPQTVRINGEPVRASRLSLMMTTLAARAASGDIKAAALVIAMIEKMFGFEDRSDGPRRLSAQDQAILDELLASPPAVAAKPIPEIDGDDEHRPPSPDEPAIESQPRGEKGEGA